MKKKLPLFIYFAFLIIYLEILYKGYVLHNIFTTNTLLLILFSVPFIYLFTVLSSLFNQKINRIISIIWSILLTLIYGSQLIYFVFYNSIFSIFSLTNGAGQAADFMGEIINKILGNFWILLFMILPTILFIIFGKKVFEFKREKLIFRIELISLVVTSVLLAVIINFSDKGMYSLKRLYKETHAPMITINRVGLLSMEVVDIQRFLFGFEEKMFIEDVVTNEEPVVLEPEIKYNVLDIDFETLIAEEKDETVLSMHNYFSSLAPTKQNDYTGMFKDKNLVYITAEGFDAIAVDEMLTPTLYKLVNNGFVFENYYQPLFTVSTSDGEYQFMNSLIPKEGVWSFFRSSNIYMPYGLGRVFKTAGYDVVNAYHDHTYTYYDRDKSHPNLGFDNYIGCGNGLQKLMNCKQWPESDVEMIDATINDYINADKFATYYMTVSGHLNYNFMGNSMSAKNRSFVKDLPYSEHVQAYLAANIELDRALEKLMKYLEEAGKLDDTVIVISPDHYPYGLTDSELNEISKTDRSDKFEKYHTSLVLYNSAMEENVKVTKYVSSIDVLPTVYNLFGITFDSRLLMGRDALSEEDGLVMLSNRSWINENGKYDSISGKFTAFNDNLPEDYVEKMNKKVYQKFTMSSLLLYEKGGRYLDYYSKLGLDKLTPKVENIPEEVKEEVEETNEN